ncbi:putative septum site-determining protein MinC [Ostertagia ostertagi]
MLRLLISVLIVAISRAELDCDAIDKAFRVATDTNETEACKCFHKGFDATIDGITIGFMLRPNAPSYFEGITFGERIIPGEGQHLGLSYHNHPIGYVRPELRELSINDNDITTIQDGTFAKLTSLKKLSLSGNQISVITRNMFKGLDSLEVLNLQNNQITSIDWSAFANLKQLRTLDLGTNHFTNVELRGLENLQKLFLNNNSINSLKRVSLRDLPSLILLSLDRNSISEIADGDLSGLARSTRLESLTIAANNISQVKPKYLSIERSFLALLRENALGTIGPRLHGLYLRNNHLKGVNRSMLQGLTSLRELDLSGNRISSLVTGVFDLTPELRELSINDNDITTIQDGTFAKLTSLKKLSLSGNQISVITRNMFKGLDSLEVLNLQNNQITSIDWSAFANLKQLRTLDLGTNHFTNVELRGLENLQKLFLNNNSINSLKRDLPSLILLSLDRNSISEIADGDLSGLARSTRLESLTIAANNISQISQRAFSPVQHLNVLAMQNNQLTTLTKGGQSYLQPLRRLTTLLVSGNQLRAIGEHDLPRTLLVLAADHNLIEKIDVKAFDGMTLHKLFINNNKLPFLHRHTFDSISFDTLEAIDITCELSRRDKKGRAVAGQEASSVGTICGSRPVEAKPTTQLYVVELTWVVLMRPLVRRTDSDLHKLIADVDPLIARDLGPPRKLPLNGDKKRVRFEDN